MPGLGQHPDVYVQEVSTIGSSIPSVDASVPAFLGVAQKGPVGVATQIQSFADYLNRFGNFLTTSYLTYAVNAYFKQGGNNLGYVTRLVHFNSSVLGGALGAGVYSAGAIIAPRPTGGTQQTTNTILNVSVPNGIAVIPAGTILLIGGQIAVVSSAQIGTISSGVYTYILQLVTLTAPLPLGPPANNTVVADYDPLTFRQSCYSQAYVFDANPNGNIVNAGDTTFSTGDFSLSFQSVYDGLFYNGISIGIQQNPSIKTTLASTFSYTQGMTLIPMTSVYGMKIGNVLAIGTAGNAIQEFVTIQSINATLSPPVVTIGSPGLQHTHTASNPVTDQSFNVLVYSANVLQETFFSCNMNNQSQSYVVSKINNALSGSKFVTVTDLLNFGPTTLGGTENQYPINNVPNGYYQVPITPATTNALSPNLLHIPQPPLYTPIFLAGGLDGIYNPVTSAYMMVDADYIGVAGSGNNLGTGLYSLDNIAEVVLNICIPGITTPNVQQGLANYSTNRADCVSYLDSNLGYLPNQMASLINTTGSLGTSYAALYYPWVLVPDPIGSGFNPTKLIPPCGYAIGVASQTDKTRGVFKAPAGTQNVLVGAVGLEYKVSNADQDLLNPIGVNCIRNQHNIGPCVMGARTLSSNTGDIVFNVLNVRRIFLQIEKELQLGTKWAVFEPNDNVLWKKLVLTVNQYLRDKFQQRYFQGATPATSYSLVCDGTNNTPQTVTQNIVNITVGLAASRPAEFVYFQIGQSQDLTTIAELTVSS